MTQAPEARPTNEIYAAINEMNQAKLSELGYFSVHRPDLAPLYANDRFLIVPHLKYWDGLPPKSFEAQERIRADLDHTSRFTDPSYPGNTLGKLVQGHVATLVSLFPRSLGRAVIEYRGLFGVELENPNIPPGVGHLFRLGLDDIIKSGNFGMEYRTSDYYKPDPKLSFFITKTLIADISQVHTTMQNFENYLHHLQSHLSSSEIMTSITKRKSIIHWYYSPEQQRELITILSQMHTMQIWKVLLRLHQNPDILKSESGYVREEKKEKGLFATLLEAE